ncbi:prepilin-type processing-associated H-X9-DG domain-containing protein [Abditibacterium utsteinense]|uniref:Prepilin-type processing-associated H-X9-DG domain-containing protein n=1 Tax=Abditibacterium utsteinense TaxID=1960156 RepID=A0A2S8SX35_9BACT|nr:H-X9-DG-CTERM domain-containing protein [Abditibacterium utsteinense]PQV65309.1 prepilin-type processing-associated H-X9-DG domain-containing protein [Abditibacterium utsteinense]
MDFRPFIKPAIGISVFLGLGYLILNPVFMHAKVGAQRQMCQSNLKQIARAYAQYMQDSSGISPPISRGDKGWADMLQPYAKSWKLFQCPAGAKSSTSRRSDYFYNARLAGVHKVPFPNQTIVFGDGYDNSGANSHLMELPLEWKGDENKAENRHWFGGNYAFADGHVKWIPSERVSTLLPTKNESNWKATFAVR